MVWNRLRYVKNPDTGKRVSRLNPSSEWITRTFRTCGSFRTNSGRPRNSARNIPGARCSGRHGHGEPAAVPVLGTDEMRRVRRGIHHVVENRLCALAHATRALREPSDDPPRRSRSARADALQDTLLRQDLFEEFCDEFTREMNRLRMEHRASLSAAEREIERVRAGTQD